MDLARTLESAVVVAREAGELVACDFPLGAMDQVGFKGSVNPVTETDAAAERLIRERLRDEFPGHRILAEEGGGDAWREPGPPIWLVDPLDGTNNFAHGFPQVGVSLALVNEQQPLVGVVHDPLRGETFTAVAGAGATLNDRPIHVTEVADDLGEPGTGGYEELARLVLPSGRPDSDSVVGRFPALDALVSPDLRAVVVGSVHVRDGTLRHVEHAAVGLVEEPVVAGEVVAGKPPLDFLAGEHLVGQSLALAQLDRLLEGIPVTLVVRTGPAPERTRLADELVRVALLEFVPQLDRPLDDLYVLGFLPDCRVDHASEAAR